MRKPAWSVLTGRSIRHLGLLSPLMLVAACEQLATSCPKAEPPYVLAEGVYGKYGDPLIAAREQCRPSLPSASDPRAPSPATGPDAGPGPDPEPGPAPGPGPAPQPPERPQPDTFGHQGATP